MRRQVLDALYAKGTLVEPEAVDFLCKQPDPFSLINRYLAESKKESPMILTLIDLQKMVGNEQASKAIDLLPPSKPSNPDAKEIRILKDITGNSTCVGDISNFVTLFRDRYESVKKLLMRRRELQGFVSIAKAKNLNRDVRIIGMVTEARTTKSKGHKLIELEDETGSVSVLILKNSPIFSEFVVNDEVVGIVGKTAKKGDMIVADEIIRPDIPMSGGMEKTDSDAWVAFAGDVHVGSTTFLENHWGTFMEWLKTSKEARDIKYLVMPGDLVDGIGIYPDQEDELQIEDVYRQYETLAEYLKDVRDDIRIIACPGNHDAVRLAEPQPSLPESISKYFDSNVMMTGNPSLIEIERRKILIYHGKSFDDWIAAIPGLSYSKPLDVMKEMLRRRHLAPIYGDKTAIAPELKDHLVIDDVPDIFVTGHVHHAGIGDYRGVVMINSSCWQSQTSFQKMHNHVPDPCKAFLVHLGTGKRSVANFN